MIGKMYMIGQGVPKDSEQALKMAQGGCGTGQRRR